MYVGQPNKRKFFTYLSMIIINTLTSFCNISETLASSFRIHNNKYDIHCYLLDYLL